jgi:hypothetical protein
MAKQLELKISDKCLNYLDQLKKEGYPLFYEHRSGSGGFNYKKGIPDMYIVIGVIHIECEMKTPYGHLSTMQVKWRDRLIKNGTPYINPRSFEEFKTFIDSYLPK